MQLEFSNPQYCRGTLRDIELSSFGRIQIEHDIKTAITISTRQSVFDLCLPFTKIDIHDEFRLRIDGSNNVRSTIIKT